MTPRKEEVAVTNASSSSSLDDHPLMVSLKKLDPILQFLTKATGQAVIALPTIRQTLPNAFFTDDNAQQTLLDEVQALVEKGILHIQNKNEKDGDDNPTSSRELSWQDGSLHLGFPPSDETNINAPLNEARQGLGTLHGSTKSAAKRRLAALKRMLKAEIKEKEQMEKKRLQDAKVQSKSKKQQKKTVLESDEKMEEIGNQTDKSPKKEQAKEQQSCDHETSNMGKVITPEKNDMDHNFNFSNEEDVDEALFKEEQDARKALMNTFKFHQINNDEAEKDSEKKPPATQTHNHTKKKKVDKDSIPTCILPRQAAFAGSHPAQPSVYETLSDECQELIPPALLQAFGIQAKDTKRSSILNHFSSRRLFRHQVAAIEAALVKQQHVSVCTGTGSGKSLCFLLPVLAAAYRDNATSLLLFPTKALAQDQLSKLQQVLGDHHLLDRIRPVTLDGDTPHAARAEAAETANVILTNPDTLHADVLPSWRKTKEYTQMLSNVRYVVIDEAHMYEGVFGAHVAMILRRLVRVCAASAATSHYGTNTKFDGNKTVIDNSATKRQSIIPPIFLSASATLPWPEHHFRQLCPVGNETPVLVLTSEEDGSPRSAKHFFVWNPPVLHADGTRTNQVTFPPSNGTNETSPSSTKPNSGKKRKRQSRQVTSVDPRKTKLGEASLAALDIYEFGASEDQIDPPKQFRHGYLQYYRQHAADETALLLARAVSQGIRCIAFCKTRNLVEWVYSKTLDALKKDPSTADLGNKVESYRGGYSMAERRQIEQRLFSNDVLGVVGTNALELGVDIGGIDLTLHCGYPSTHASLLQQAGRAGRGKDKKRLDVPSLSVVICFNSPSEQHIWRRPKSLLGKGISAPNTIPFTRSLVQSHMLCASDEFPLTGTLPATAIFGKYHYDLPDHDDIKEFMSDAALFGDNLYDQCLQSLISSNSVLSESVQVMTEDGKSSTLTVYRAHASLHRLTSRVSIRSIEPVNFSIVNLAHSGQGGRMDGIYDENAVMDTIPYSRVFYHAHPGAIIQHRARKFKIVSMTRPPAFIAENFSYKRSLNLAAFAKPSNARYMTRPLSNLHITVIKQIERVELHQTYKQQRDDQVEDQIENNVSSKSELKGDPKDGNSDLKQEDSTTAAKDQQGITLAGCGAVSVKRDVHGYKKLSLINRTEISREELSLPPIEYDTFGLYIGVDVDILQPLLGDSFGPGVHALSHAILAVAPNFAHGLVRSDLDCDHSFYAPTHVMIFDERAGGSGSVERLWNCFFDPHNNIIDAAVDLLEQCSFCRRERSYDGGCPSCLHASNCIKFNMHLSRSAAIVVGKRMLEQIKKTALYQSNLKASDSNNKENPETCKDQDTPRKKSRNNALQNAKEMHHASERQYVIGRPSWPMDI